MHMGGAHVSVSLASVELLGDGDGTRMIFTEQAVYLAGTDGTEARRHGTGAHFDRLAAYLGG